ncbi:MAG: uroporphyrinogen decarboxylase, partial [Clostridia bacterium]
MGKQLIFDILQHKEVERAAWVPFAGIHAGKLTGATAKEVLTDENKLFEALMEVNKIYVPD